MRTINHTLLCKIGGGFYLTPFICGSVLGAVGYTVGNKNDFYINGLAIATIGGGITATLDSLGAFGKILQVVNVAITSEIVYYIQNHKF